MQPNEEFHGRFDSDSKIVIEPYIETHSGKRMYFLNPTPEMIDIEDIAHALSNICRFGGHTNEFYSVAEHSFHVSAIADNQLEGLLHDASEAYLVDIPKPIKGYLENYKEIEDGLMKAISSKFGSNWPLSEDTHDADATMLKAEAHKLMRTGGKDWIHKFKTKRDYHERIRLYRWDPAAAKEAFLDRFTELTKRKT